jgi:adenylate kinase
MKILLMGPPASGKGTIGEKLSSHMGIPVMSGGGLLRNIPEDHPRYKEINDLMNSGELSPQDFVAELLRNRVNQPDCVNGYIIDGWGRNMIDLEYFDPGFDKVIVLNLSEDSAIKRISGRRVCSNCKEMFNVYYVPSKVEGVCDKCGGDLIQRKDDTPEVVKRRYQVQWVDSQDVVLKFRNDGVLVEIDGEGSPDEVFTLVLNALK